MARNEVEVEIYGQRHTVTGGGDPSYIIEITRYVDNKMRELARSMRTSTTSQLAILVAINLADELSRVQRERAEEHRILENWAAETILSIEQDIHPTAAVV